MPACFPNAALLLLLFGAPAVAQPFTTSGDLSGTPRFTVTADTADEAREVPISPNRAVIFLFNTPVQAGGAIVEERERFRQVSLSEDGLMLTLLPSGELKPSRRLTLTVRFADGAPPTSLDFTLVVSPRAEVQVEVYRQLRPCDSYRQQSEEAEARVLQCQTQLARERAERDAPGGLIGLLVLNHMDENGIRSRRIIEDISLRPGEAFTVDRAVSYRAMGGEEDARVTRLAVELTLWNRGAEPWTPTHAQLVGQGGRWDLEVWPPRPIAPGESLRVLVEVEVPGEPASGPYLLKLWDESTARTLTLSGVMFP
ncbi:DUF2381 family protein [Archangium lansingense]|uniref:DUF2381 family protein n=1 Tax=Archangium lansingense TaxID=2995310 RepID=UPI003B7F774A